MKTLYRLLPALLVALLFAGCEKKHFLDIKTTYCTAVVNGVEYKDAATVRDELQGHHGYPIDIHDRIFFRPSIEQMAFLQFQLSDAEGQSGYHLFGGIAFSAEESFPILNKSYPLMDDADFDFNALSDKKKAEVFLNHLRTDSPQSLPAGVMFIRSSQWIYPLPPISPLRGSLTFTAFNSKNNRYKASFSLSGGEDSTAVVVTGNIYSPISFARW